MADRLNFGSLYRADLLWCLHAIAKDQHSEVAELLGFEEKPVIKKAEPEVTTLSGIECQISAMTAQVVMSQANKAEGSSYYRMIDRQVDPDKIAQAQGAAELPDWFIKASPSYFAETETRIPALHRIKPVYPPLVAWSRLWPMLLRELGKRVPGSKPDINKLVKKVSQGQKIRHIPKCTRYTWAENINVLIDINDGNFPYRQDFLRLQQQLIAWRGSDGLAVHFIYDEPGAYISHYQDGKETIEPWRHPEPNTPLLILSDLGLHSQSRRSVYQWLAFGQQLSLNGIRATVLMPVAEREIDQRLLRYFDCIVWDGNSTLKPVQAQDRTEQTHHPDNGGTEKLLALLFPALRVELGLLRAVRRLLPTNACDVSHEAAVWHHVAINSAGDEWGWQASSGTAYQESFLTQFQQLPQIKQQQLLEQLGIYHAQLPDELYFEAMHHFIRLGLELPEQVKTATLAFMSMLVKTYSHYPEQQSLALWVQRFLLRHDDAAMRSEHQLAFMAIEHQRKHQQLGTAIEWPADIDPQKMTAFIEPKSAIYFILLSQKGMELELLSEPESILPEDEWGKPSVLIERMVQHTNSLTLSYPAIDGKQLKFTLNLESDTPYRFTLPPGTHQIEIAEESFTVEVQSAGDKADWVCARGVDGNGLFVDTLSREGKSYRWYWHSPEITRQPAVSEKKGPQMAWEDPRFWREWHHSIAETKDQELTWQVAPGFWHYQSPNDKTDLTPDWADQAGRDRYGLYADVSIAGVTQRFRWIQPGSFLIGSPEHEQGRNDDEIQHQVSLSQGYWLADTTCTQALWQAVMGNNPSHFKGENRPVESVSWNDAQKFIKQLNRQQTQLDLRLPSEAEWEYACRAGTLGGFNFEGKLSLVNVNYRAIWEYEGDKWGKGSLHQTIEVKSYPSNASGLYEMHGNVWEWCHDRYGGYSAQPVIDPQDLEKGAYRVLRGGSWIGYGKECRSASRRDYLKDRSGYGIGFRLARGHQSRQTSASVSQQTNWIRGPVARGVQAG